jgi:hypothetical protein
MSEIPVWWHGAVNPVHRQVALASFLQLVLDSHWQIFYAAHDYVAPVIVELAPLVGVTCGHWHPGSIPQNSAPWVWIQSHEYGHQYDFPAPPQAVLCLGTVSIGVQRTHIPAQHQPYVTGERCW